MDIVNTADYSNVMVKETNNTNGSSQEGQTMKTTTAQIDTCPECGAELRKSYGFGPNWEQIPMAQVHTYGCSHKVAECHDPVGVLDSHRTVCDSWSQAEGQARLHIAIMKDKGLL